MEVSSDNQIMLQVKSGDIDKLGILFERYKNPLFGEQLIATYEETERSHEALIYDPSRASGRWEASKIEPGQVLEKPTPLYKKLDDSIIEEERSRLGQPTE